jgi:type I restriction enzyme S subunit
MFYKETNFKDTEIGELPNDWEVVRLGDGRLFKIIMGQSPPSSTYNEKGQGLPFLQGKMEFGEIHPSPTLYCSRPIKIAEQNDVLISVRAPVGDVNVAPYKLCIGRGLAAIRFNSEKTNNWFYFYYLQKIKNFLENLGKGSTFKAITREDLENLKVPYPPLLEQQKIAEVLLIIDKIIQKTNEIIAKTERLKKGLMQELLTKGIGHKEFKDTEIGRIPKTWGVVKLGEITKQFISGGTPSTKNPDYWNGDIPWIRSVHLTKYYIDETSIERYITKEGLENSASNIVPKGNVIIATRVGIGKSAVNLIDVAINQDLTGLVIDKSKINPFFLVWYLHSPKILNILESFARGTTIKGIPQDYIKNLLIPLPPTNEQQKIAEILSLVDKMIENEKNEKVRLEKIKRSLMNLLLTGKIRVRV